MSIENAKECLDRLSESFHSAALRISADDFHKKAYTDFSVSLNGEMYSFRAQVRARLPVKSLADEKPFIQKDVEYTFSIFELIYEEDGEEPRTYEVDVFTFNLLSSFIDNTAMVKASKFTRKELKNATQIHRDAIIAHMARVNDVVGKYFRETSPQGA